MRMARKVYLGLALAAIVAAAVVAPAYASVGSGYLTWDSASPGSPHGGYATTTNKCAVCHAVHNADATGELLLKGTVAGACNYCHVGGLGGYTQVYGGVVANYQGTDLSGAHNFYGGGGVTCSQCHQVHAADATMTANAYLTTKLLIGAKTDFTQYDSLAGVPLSTDTSNTALTKWCTKCHDVGLGTNNTYYNGYDYPGSGFDSFSYPGGHVMTTATANYAMPDGSTRRVAWLDSTQCASCHSAGYTTSAWPHYTAGAARFLMSAGASTSSTAGAVEPSDDGVCLRCHREGTSGIGLDY